MSTAERPKGRRLPLCALVLAVLLPAALAVAGWLAADASADESPTSAWVVPGICLGLCAVVAALLLWWRDGPALRGAAALFWVLLAVAGLVLAIGRLWPTDIGTRFLVVVGLAGLALASAAAEWSRQSLLRLGLALTLGVGVVITQVGVDALRPEEPAASPEDRLATAKKEHSELRRQAREAREEAAEDAQQEADTLDELLLMPSPLVPAAARTRAQAIVVALRRPGRSELQTAKDALATFDTAYVAAASSPRLTQVRRQAVVAVDARQEAQAPPPAQRNLSMAVLKANRVQIAAREANRTASRNRDTAADAFDAAVDTVELELARYRHAVTGTKEDKAALDALEAPPEDEPITLLDALAKGPSEVLDDLVPGDEPPTLVPGPVGWVLLAGMALAAWTVLLRWNARQLAGPVDVTGLTGKTDETDEGADQADRLAELRIAVLENVAEPGAAPGSTATSPVTTLLDTFVDKSNWVKQVIELVLKLVGERDGYKVSADVAGDARVLVRIKDLRTGTTLATNVERGPDTDVTVRAAGLWAAGEILHRSTRIPSWAEWNADTAKALATAKQRSPSVEDLEAAVRTAPDAGLLLYKLGHAYELDGRQHEALVIYARAVAAHPRYVLARYRLGTALGMLSRRDTSDPWVTDDDARAAAVDALARALRRLGLDTVTVALDLAFLRCGVSWGEQGAFRRLAVTVLGDLQKATTRRNLLAASLRRADRDLVLPVVLSLGLSGRRNRLSWVVRSAGAVYSMSEPEVARIVRQADKPGTWWQISYNAACATAATDSRKAMRLLEQCLVRPGVHQLDARWVRRDPDLEPLGGERFKAFLRRLDGGTE